MYLEGDKWKNWHTRCSDAAIKENKSEEDTKLSTISVSKLLEYAHTALHHCEINNLDPYKVPVFLTLERDNNLYSNIGLGICCSSQLGTYVTLESSDYYKMLLQILNLKQVNIGEVEVMIYLVLQYLNQLENV